MNKITGKEWGQYGPTYLINDCDPQSKAEQKQKAKLKKEYPVGDVWSADDSAAVEGLSTKLTAADRVAGIILSSAEAVVKELRERKSGRDKATDTDFEIGYATVVLIRDDYKRSMLYKSVCTVLGKKRYKSSDLMSLTLQSMGFSEDLASKRATIGRHALRNKVPPTKLMEFVREQGGLEKCLDNARSAQELEDFNFEVALVGRSTTDDTAPVKVHLAFPDKIVAHLITTLMAKLSPEARAHACMVEEKTLQSVFERVAREYAAAVS